MDEASQTQEQAEKRRRACVEALARLGPTLEHLVVSAEMTEGGELRSVGGLDKKIAATLAPERVSDIHAAAFHVDQCTEGGDLVRKTSTYAERIVGPAPPFKRDCPKPIVLAADFQSLVDQLDRDLNSDERFGKRLDIPPSLIGDTKHYAPDRHIPRRWLQNAILDFINENKSGYIVIAADALYGKTSFALDWWRSSREAQLLQQHGHDGKYEVLPPLSGAAFIRQTDGNKYVSPTAILEALEAETRYRLNIPRSKIHVGASADGLEDREGVLKKRFDIFLDDLKKSIQVDRRAAVLLLDGVDEIWGPSGVTPGALLPGALNNELPDGVFIVLLSRPGPHLRWKVSEPRHCLRIVLDSESTDAEAVRWRTLNREDLAQIIEDRANKLEKRDPHPLPGDVESARLLRAFAKPLLEAAQDHLFVLTPILGNNDDLAADLREWRDHPDRLPKSHMDLVARVLERIRNALVRAKDKRRLGGLNADRHALQTLACLAVVACMREALPTLELKSLLFSANRKGRAGEYNIRRPDSCGPLEWSNIKPQVLETALRFGAECFAGSKPESLPKTSAFWHPQMRKAVRAAWRIASRTGTWPAKDEISAEMAHFDEQEVTEAECPLHHWIAAASSRFWPPDGPLAKQAGAASDYAIAQGAWHAAQTADAVAIERAANALTDTAFLQSAYFRRGEYALQPLNSAMGSVSCTPSLGAATKTRVFHIRRTLIQHDRVFVKVNQRNAKFLPEIPIAAALYNDLLGMPQLADSPWGQTLKKAAQLSGGILRRIPGIPTSFLRTIETGDPEQEVAISPCGNWLAITIDEEIVLYRTRDVYQLKAEFRLPRPSTYIRKMVFSAALGETIWLSVASDGSDSLDGSRSVQLGLLPILPSGPTRHTFINVKWSDWTITGLCFSAPLAGNLWLAIALDCEAIGLLAINANGPTTSLPIWKKVPNSYGPISSVTFSPTILGTIWLAVASRFFHLNLMRITLSGLEDNLTPIDIGRSNADIAVHSGVSCGPVFSELIGDTSWLACNMPAGIILLPVSAERCDISRATRIHCEFNFYTHLVFPPVSSQQAAYLMAVIDFQLLTVILFDIDGQWKKQATNRQGERGICVLVHSDFSDYIPWLAYGTEQGKISIQRLIADRASTIGKGQVYMGHRGPIRHISFFSSSDGIHWIVSSSRQMVGIQPLFGDEQDTCSLPHTNENNARSAPTTQLRNIWLSHPDYDDDGVTIGARLSSRLGEGGDVVIFDMSKLDSVFCGTVIPRLIDTLTLNPMFSGEGKFSPEISWSRLLGEAHAMNPKYAQVSPDGTRKNLLLASASSTEVIVFEAPNADVVARASFAGTGEQICGLRWSEDGTELYIAGSFGTSAIDLTLCIPCPLQVPPEHFP